MKRLVVLAILLAACGDNFKGSAIDAAVDAAPNDTAMIDAEVDAMVDAMPTPAEAIDAVRAAANGAISLPVIDATVTYLKPMIAGASMTNDPAGFTVQVGATGPALFVAVDPATLTTLTPALAVGDVVSFTATMKGTAGSSPRATEIMSITRSATATNIASLVQDVTAVTGLVAMVGDFDSELIDVTAATITAAFTDNSGASFSRASITTAGVATVDSNFQLRVPTAFKNTFVAASDLETNCVVAIHRTPVNRFGAAFQVSAFNTTDITVTSCPAPTVAGAMPASSSTVTVTFSRNLDMTSVMTDGTQFTISDGTNPLAVSAASVTGARTVQLTTAPQVPGTTYTVTVGNTVEDVLDRAVGTPNMATFSGFSAPSVMMAAATNATTITVMFTANLDTASVMTDGSQFTITETTTPANTLAVSAASVAGMVVTLTTASQTPGTMYTVTVTSTVTGGGMPAVAPLSASFLGYTPPAAANHLVISELDYDLVGTDTNGEYVEIYNPTAGVISLTGLRVVFVNGATSAAPALYASNPVYELSSLVSLDPGQYLVLGPAALVTGLPVTVKSVTMTGTTDLIQQGPRDSVFLVDVGDAGASIAPRIVDSISYEGNTSANLTYDAAGQSLVLVPEGASGVDDSDSIAGSLCRLPDGVDTDSNAADFRRCTTPTPGVANM
ncbi:MAG: lamin tail domain-containing protein [Kofleriaceae bacterium]